MSVKGLTKKQMVMWLDGVIGGEDTCITEHDVKKLFNLFGDTYLERENVDYVDYTLVMENDYWYRLRNKLPRQGDKLKGIYE